MTPNRAVSVPIFASRPRYAPFFVTPSFSIIGLIVPLFDGHTFGKVAGFINVASAQNGNMVRKQRHRECRGACGRAVRFRASPTSRGTVPAAARANTARQAES